jgi:hypothetical protein
VQSGLKDFVDLWAWTSGPSEQLVALVALTPLHTLPLSPGQLQGWMQSIVLALRSAVPVAVVPVDAAADVILRSVVEQLCEDH